jgi:GTP-binding protein
MRPVAVPGGDNSRSAASGWGKTSDCGEASAKDPTGSSQDADAILVGENRFPCLIGVDGFDPHTIKASPAQQKRTGELFARPGHFCGASKDAEGCAAVNTANAPEIAFAGRSNAGKSTLLNALMGTGALVKTSKVAGKTKGVNFFELGPRPGRRENLMLVDMPGYGHARGSKAHQRELAGRIFAYALGRGPQHVRQVFLLMDGRRGPMAADRLMAQQMDQRGVNYRLVLTKADAASERELHSALQRACAMAKSSTACDPCVHIVSSKAGIGLRELRQAAVRAAFPERDDGCAEAWRATWGSEGSTRRSSRRAPGAPGRGLPSQAKLRSLWQHNEANRAQNAGEDQAFA